ncbi:MAG: endonuclease/exonuclease/phosphatase family protein, partial [Gammaproteobacteria bacterium]
MFKHLALAMLMGMVTSAAGAGTLAVVAFNVDSADASDDFIATQLRKSEGIDIWGLTEVWQKQGWPETLRLGAEKGGDTAYGSLLGSTGANDRMLILYRRDRLELLASEEILEARATERHAAPLAAHFRPGEGPDFMIVVVNFSDQASRRAQQSAGLAAWAQAQTLPVVAVGSFNFDLREDESDTEFDRFLASAGWSWLRPEPNIGTWCGRRGRIADNVLLGGEARSWRSDASVMYPQNNYCPDDVRSSDHRPVLARFAFDGTVAVPEASMQERQVRPFLPGDMAIQTGLDDLGSDEETAPVTQEEYDALKRRVEELEAKPPVAPAAAPVVSPVPSPEPAPAVPVAPAMPATP